MWLASQMGMSALSKFTIIRLAIPMGSFQLRAILIHQPDMITSGVEIEFRNSMPLTACNNHLPRTAASNIMKNRTFFLTSLPLAVTALGLQVVGWNGLAASADATV